MQAVKYFRGRSLVSRRILSKALFYVSEQDNTTRCDALRKYQTEAVLILGLRCRIASCRVLSHSIARLGQRVRRCPHCGPCGGDGGCDVSNICVPILWSQEADACVWYFPPVAALWNQPKEITFAVAWRVVILFCFKRNDIWWSH